MGVRTLSKPALSLSLAITLFRAVFFSFFFSAHWFVPCTVIFSIFCLV